MSRRILDSIPRRPAFTAAAGLLLVSGLTGCGGVAKPSAAAATQNGCRQVAAVLSDGPDPGADPVGYAEAQIQQLRLLHGSPQRLQRTIDSLASAYQLYSSSNGADATAKRAATQAMRAMNAICPSAGAAL